jgi:hypothetical protein
VHHIYTWPGACNKWTLTARPSIIAVLWAWVYIELSRLLYWHVMMMIKVKFKLSLSLTKHHAIKTYWVNGGTVLRILNFFTSWRWVVSYASRPLYPMGRAPGTHWIGRWMGSRAGLNAVAKRKFPNIAPAGNWTPVVQSVLSYPGSW